MSNNTTNMSLINPLIHQLMLVSMSVTMALSIAGNCFLAFCILQQWHSRKHKGLSRTQILLLHQCVADTLFALLTILPTLVKVTRENFLIFEGTDAWCRCSMYLSLIPMWASPFLLVSMSADRYYAICRPWQSLRDGKNRTHLLALVAWLLSILIPMPQLFIFHLKIDGNNRYCMPTYTPYSWETKVYVMWFTVGAWLVPTTVSGCFYWAVGRCVWTSLSGTKNAIALPEMTVADRADMGTACDDYTRKLRANSTVTQKRLDNIERQRNKTVKLTLTIVVCNFLLFSPFCVSNVIHSFDPTALDPIVTTAIMLVGNLNSCVNPWIYIAYNRSQLSRLFRRRRGAARAGAERHRSRRSRMVDFFSTSGQVTRGASMRSNSQQNHALLNGRLSTPTPRMLRLRSTVEAPSEQLTASPATSRLSSTPVYRKAVSYDHSNCGQSTAIVTALSRSRYVNDDSDSLREQLIHHEQLNYPPLVRFSPITECPPHIHEHEQPKPRPRSLVLDSPCSEQSTASGNGQVTAMQMIPSHLTANDNHCIEGIIQYSGGTSPMFVHNDTTVNQRPVPLCLAAGNHETTPIIV